MTSSQLSLSLARVKTKINNNTVWHHRKIFFLISFIILQKNQVLGNRRKIYGEKKNDMQLDEEEEILPAGDDINISPDDVDALLQQQQQQQQDTSPTMTATGETQASFAEEESLLDLFGESAKDFLTHRLIPSTDASCRWDWKNLRCESHCDCTFQPTWGDYHLGRSCRARPTPLPEDKRDLCHLPPDNDNPLHHVRNVIQSTRDRVEPLLRKVDLDFSGRMALVKGEVCESWLSSAVEDGSSGAGEEGEGLGLPPFDEDGDGTAYANPTGAGVSSDGGVLSKPIRKLRKLFNCEAGV